MQGEAERPVGARCCQWQPHPVPQAAFLSPLLSDEDDDEDSLLEPFEPEEPLLFEPPELFEA